MAVVPYIELGRGRKSLRIPVLYEDRSVLAIDKPAGWILSPSNWDRTSRNLQKAIEDGISRGDFWARSRNLKFLRYVHRLDAETTGVLLMVKSRGAIRAYSRLFQERRIEKVYLAVVHGFVDRDEWICRLSLREVDTGPCKVVADVKLGKPAVTRFIKLASRMHPELGPITLLAAEPETGRTHQIRVHLAGTGYPVVGDRLYGKKELDFPHFGLRSTSLSYIDPFTRKMVRIVAPAGEFVQWFGFSSADISREKVERFMGEKATQMFQDLIG